MITAEQANEIRNRENALQAWIDTIRGPNGWASYHPEDKPASVPDVTNDERSALELFEFVNDPPRRYFVYVNERDKTVTTFTGDMLGSVQLGVPYRSAFGDKRIPVTVHGINGIAYYGTYYADAGCYARLTAYKHQS